MKKQFLLLIIMILAGVCFSSLNDNGLMACCKKTTTCSGAVKTNQQKMQVEYSDDENASLDIFTNPFKQL